MYFKPKDDGLNTSRGIMNAVVYSLLFWAVVIGIVSLWK